MVSNIVGAHNIVYFHVTYAVLLPRYIFIIDTLKQPFIFINSIIINTCLMYTHIL